MAHNPVERRLLGLGNRWRAFCEDVSKRLLIWRVPDNSIRMLQCFFAVQKHDTELATGDLFIIFDTAFENSIKYSREVKESLAGQYAASHDDLVIQGISPDWNYAPNNFPDSSDGVLSSLRSFVDRHHEVRGHIAAVLMPSSVDSGDAFQAWIERALTGNIPERLRLVVIDTFESPRLLSLVESQHPLVFVDNPPIDALSAAQETFAQEGGTGPAAVFRNYLMALVALTAKGSADQVKAKSGDALAFARKQQWLDQEAVVGMMVAGAFLKENRFPEAVEQYQDTRGVAQRAVEIGHPVGKDLVVQTWFGQAGAHLAAGDTADAANCYDQAAAVAGAIPNLILAIEARRMGMFCYARLNNRDAAIERGHSAMDFGEKLEPDMRNNTTMPIAAIDLLRVIEPPRVAEMEKIKQRRDATNECARSQVEQQAAAEKQGDSTMLAAAESHQANEDALAKQTAYSELDPLVDNGSEQFHDVFAHARDLLGQEWPLENPIALPQAPTPQQGCTPA